MVNEYIPKCNPHPSIEAEQALTFFYVSNLVVGLNLRGQWIDSVTQWGVWKVIVILDGGRRAIPGKNAELVGDLAVRSSYKEKQLD